MTKSLDVEIPSNLTSDQNQAINIFRTWFEDSSLKEPFVLSGYAGTGKTFLAMKFLKLVEEKRLCWTVAAPTHKAVGVLRKALDNEGLRPTWYPSTIHRLLRLKLKRKRDLEMCEETEQTANSLEQLALVIVDESSMIDNSLLEIVLKCAHSFGTRLVFIGDPAQLPPVGQAESSVFVMKRAVFAHLHKVVRHQGPVLKLASSIRDGRFPCELPPCWPVLKTSKGFVASLNKLDWLEAAKSSLKTAYENDNPDEARILCYTNKTLDSLVPHARRAIHGDMADQLPVLPGEILITRRAVMAAASADGEGVGEEPDMLIGSNREMMVLDVTTICCDLGDYCRFLKSDYKTPLIETLVIKVLCDHREFSLRLLPQVATKSRQDLDAALNRLSEIAKGSSRKEAREFWRAFFLVRDSFASVGPAAVLTVHRSQGSTFENVFVAPDVFTPKDICLRRQLTYVAVSRASKQVWLVGNPKEEITNNFDCS